MRIFLNLAVCLIGLGYSFPAEAQFPVWLSDTERAYLAELGPITIAPDPDWVPFEFIDADGNFSGIAADLLEIVAAKLEVEFDYIIPEDWPEAVAMSREGKVLILPFLNQTPAREEWLIFTDPLFIDPNVIITRNDAPFIRSLAELSDEIMVLPEGTSIEERIRQDLPDMQIVTVPSEREVFQMIETGEADVTVRSLAISAYTIRSQGLFNLRLNAEAPEAYTNHLRMGVLKSEPMLRDILNIGIQSISDQQRRQVFNSHVNIQIVQPTDYRLLIQVIAGTLLFMLFTTYWIYRLRSVNAALQESERSKSVLLGNLPGIAYRGRFDSFWTMDYVSDGCKVLTGYDPGDIVRNKRIAFVELIDPAYREYCLNIWEQALSEQSPARLEYPIITAQGERKWVYEQGEVIDKTGNDPIIEGLIIDITNRKHAEDILAHTSTHDELTDLYNRRLIHQELTILLDARQREGKEFCIAMIDIDHFKFVNDEYGHLAGDHILKELSALLCQNFRSCDIVGRYGGEEFIVIFPETEIPDLKDMFNRLFQKIREHDFNYRDKNINITVSAGIVATHVLGKPLSLEEVIHLADKSMYRAKKAGRDRFLIHTAPVKSKDPLN